MISMVFLLNALGVIDQNIPARETMERGAQSAMVPVMMLAGRSVELVAGMALILGIFPRLAALALLAFLVPATSSQYNSGGKYKGVDNNSNHCAHSRSRPRPYDSIDRSAA